MNRTVVAVALMFVLGACSSGDTAAPRVPTDGDGFSVTSLDGEQITSNGLRGQFVVLNFFESW